MNILITGAQGFIGISISNYLERSHNIYKIDRDVSGMLMDSNNISINLINFDEVSTFLDEFKKNNKIDIIIHCASEMASEDTIESFAIIYNNLRITENLVYMAKTLKIKKLINLSSMAVYPNIDGIFSEDSPIKTSLNSDCFYGLSKFCSENVFDFMLRKDNIIISHLRISQVYGDGMRDDRVIPIMLKELKEKNTITLYGNGERESCFIEISKLVKYIDFFIKTDVRGVYNIGDENKKYLELARTLIEKNGDENSELLVVSSGSRTKFNLDTSKFFSIYGKG